MQDFKSSLYLRYELNSCALWHCVV